MGLIDYQPGPLGTAFGNFSKAVISLWFRIPTSTFTELAGLSDTPPAGYQIDTMCNGAYSPPLFKTIPLITFGSLETDTNGASCSPSFVGVDCWGGMNTLCVNLQTTGIAAAPQPNVRPGCFYISGQGEPFIGDPANVNVSADTWHHALISFDLSGGCSADYATTPFSVSSTDIFTWAFNDVARVDSSIQPAGGARWTTNGISDPKKIIAQGLLESMGFPDSTSYGSCTIASAGNPAGIPSSSDFVSKIYKVDMADAQLFTGVYIDCSTESNRRAFITEAGGPAAPSLAIELLGKQPEILFQTSSDWTSGDNRGTIGSFTPTGTINPFTPSP